MAKPLFEINPSIPIDDLKERFARVGRVQVRDILTPETAETISDILRKHTPWGAACQAGASPPLTLRQHEFAALNNDQRRRLARDITRAAATGEYAFQFSQYSILTAYLEKWDEGGPHDLLIEYINAQPFLDLVRTICGMPELTKADAQATLFGPGDFLSVHNDSHKKEGWPVAYILNFSDPGWKPDWGGYLNFLNDDGDIIEGWRPRFNSLNLLAVPQLHQVSYVPPFAPVGRFAITGWFRS